MAMRRQRRTQHYADDDNSRFSCTQTNSYGDDILQMESMQPSAQLAQYKFENLIEAEVQEGDTLQALALRFHCTVPEIKRLNKIDKDNEIHARKVVKIPVTVQSILLETLPTVHKSGNNSPKYSSPIGDQALTKVRDPLQDAKLKLEEKLLVASVNAAGQLSVSESDPLNPIALNSRKSPTVSCTNEDSGQHPSSASDINSADVTAPLLSDILDESSVPHVRPIPGPTLSAIEWSGSDCDMSWVCLFVVILALCFVIPMIYIIYLAEHPYHHDATHL